MPRYAEFGVNTFVGSPSGKAEAYASSATPQGYFAVLAWCVPPYLTCLLASVVCACGAIACCALKVRSEA